LIRAVFFVGTKVGFVFSLLIPRKLLNLISHFKNFIYSGYYKQQFKKCGSSFSIKSPFNLIGPQFITIGNNFYAGYRLRMEVIDYQRVNTNSPELTIGNNVSFNFDCHIGCSNKVVIGNNVLFASKVFLTDHFHGVINSADLEVAPGRRLLHSKGPIIIEDNVWVGEGVCIMPNVTIGRNTIIGANSVVTKSLPQNCVAGGNPAKILKYL
jgi:acetyltransferase-like isoleucine patch superfamily enzyme